MIPLGIALTGVIMLIYLDQACEEIKEQCRVANRTSTMTDLYAAVMEGAVERVHPKMCRWRRSGSK